LKRRCHHCIISLDKQVLRIANAILEKNEKVGKHKKELG
jgi:hypothetical protein